MPPYGDKDATTKIKPTFQVFILIFRPLAGVKVQLRKAVNDDEQEEVFRPLAGVKVQPPDCPNIFNHYRFFRPLAGVKVQRRNCRRDALLGFFRPLAGVKVQQQNETKNKKRTNRTCHCFTVLILKYNITEAKKKQKRMNWAK